MGEIGNVKILEGKIARIKVQYDVTGPESSDEVRLKTEHNLHEHFVREGGERSVSTTGTGVKRASTPSQLGHGIESGRLLTK